MYGGELGNANTILEEFFRYEVTTPAVAVQLGSRVHFEIKIFPKVDHLYVHAVAVSILQVKKLRLNSKKTDVRSTVASIHPLPDAFIKSRNDRGEEKWTYHGYLQLPPSLAKCTQSVLAMDIRGNTCSAEILIRHSLRVYIEIGGQDDALAKVQSFNT